MGTLSCVVSPPPPGLTLEPPEVSSADDGKTATCIPAAPRGLSLLRYRRQMDSTATCACLPASLPAAPSPCDRLPGLTLEPPEVSSADGEYGYLLTGSPFSWIDFSFGATGTLPMHAFTGLPPTLTVQVPQLPFLQLVGTCEQKQVRSTVRIYLGASGACSVRTWMPNFLHAANIDEPSPTLHCLPPAVSLTWPILTAACRSGREAAMERADSGC